MIGRRTATRLPRGKFFIPTRVLLKALGRLVVSDMRRGDRAAVLEARLRERFGVTHCTTLSTYRMAVHFVLKALELDRGDEVLLTPITIPDTVNAIHVLGLKPVFVDMDPATHNMDLADLRRKSGDRSRVVLMTHLAGISPEMEAFAEFTASRGLALLEDFSQSYGGTWRGKPLGTFGLAGLGSLSAGKTLSSLAGGFVLTSDTGLFESLRAQAEGLHRPEKITFCYQLAQALKINLFASRPVFRLFTWRMLRFVQRFMPRRFDTIQTPRAVTACIHKDNFFEDRPILRSRMPGAFYFWFSDWQAELTLYCLDRLNEGNRRRKVLGRALLDRLSPAAMRHVAGALVEPERNTYYHFPVLCSGDRRDFQEYLLRHGIDSAGYILCHCAQAEAFRAYACDTPGADTIKGQVVFLPVHEDLRDGDITALADVVNRYYASSS